MELSEGGSNTAERIPREPVEGWDQVPAKMRGSSADGVEEVVGRWRAAVTMMEEWGLEGGEMRNVARRVEGE